VENFRLVLPEHLNHYGYLFGGQMLLWVDEISWIAASLDFPGGHFVTIAMDRVEFRHPVRGGAILRFDVQRDRVGTTSVQYTVNVFADDLDSGREESVFSTHVTFVCLDGEGRKTALPSH
jgi:acyl-CoA hydrolase